jgi:hypothetical protein
VFLSQRSHDRIVALYEMRLEESARRYEDLRLERDFYRQAWLERLGLEFPVPKPAEVTAITPSAPVRVPSELEERKTFRLDKSEWTVDDHAFYDDYHARPMLKSGTPADELEFWYAQRYGSQLPMKVFLDAAFPIS